MVRKNGRKLTDQEVVDALVAENAAKAAAEAEAPQETSQPPEPEPETEPTIADRFVQMNALIVNQRRTTRLSEATLAKMMELAFQYHAWNLQWEAQQAQRQPAFDPSILMGNGEDSDELTGPTGEFIGEAADEPTEVQQAVSDEANATEEGDTDGS